MLNIFFLLKKERKKKGGGGSNLEGIKSDTGVGKRDAEVLCGRTPLTALFFTEIVSEITTQSGDGDTPLRSEERGESNSKTTYTPTAPRRANCFHPHKPILSFACSIFRKYPNSPSSHLPKKPRKYSTFFLPLNPPSNQSLTPTNRGVTSSLLVWIM